ncbi:RNA polymerase sigma-E factor [Actinoplanes sp. NBRC 14428]|uniref:RNA polymerase sigma-70 factor (Sigma-E family) n=1 Tax=Pseudosporangium ferrugineum TaxID=439699 RepID=A0A2T0SFE3_9ACTN|nr:SigE family RNA polymerase sigma factor [Pseudosporangium ferrugineum]PRY32129.1 RNA polymerase sigma-70 factor (sigma-E family) [Pseudosporangium ferrugineum]BCJ49628.1 RNA polymerase sigma-E factor [Actinoplanes sp. NBRC 14428]
MDSAAEQHFREFVATRTPALMRTAYLLTGNQHDAEDLLQGALTGLAMRLRSIDVLDLEAYVRRAMYHRQVDRWRVRLGRRETPTDPRAVQLDAVVGDSSGRIATKLLVQDGLRRLTAKQRAVVVLRYYEDLPEAEIAAQLGWSVGTVRSTIHRSMAKLRSLVPDLAALREEM